MSALEQFFLGSVSKAVLLFAPCSVAVVRKAEGSKVLLAVDFVDDSGTLDKGVLNLRVGGGAAYPRLAFCFMVLAVLIIVALGVVRLRTGRLGAAMLAVRANERSAAAAGVMRPSGTFSGMNATSTFFSARTSGTHSVTPAT